MISQTELQNSILSLLKTEITWGDICNHYHNYPVPVITLNLKYLIDKKSIIHVIKNNNIYYQLLVCE